MYNQENLGHQFCCLTFLNLLIQTQKSHYETLLYSNALQIGSQLKPYCVHNDVSVPHGNFIINSSIVRITRLNINSLHGDVVFISSQPLCSNQLKLHLL